MASFSLLIHVLNYFELVFSVDGAVVLACWLVVVPVWSGMVVVVDVVVAHGLVWSSS